MTDEEKERKRKYHHEWYLRLKADPKAYRLRLFEERVAKRMRYNNDPEYRARENARSKEYKRRRKEHGSTILQPQADIRNHTIDFYIKDVIQAI